MTIFQSIPGQIVAVPDPAVQCSIRLLSLRSPQGDDVSITFPTQRALVTRLTISQQVNLQFLHALGDIIYVYVFGDRMGSVTLSGLAAGCACPDTGVLGADAMLGWFKKVKASNRQAPIQVVVGTTVIEGFAVGFTEDVVDASIQLVQWGVQLAALPDDNPVSAAPGAGPTSTLSPVSSGDAALAGTVPLPTPVFGNVPEGQ